MDQSSENVNLFVAREEELTRLHGFLGQAMNAGGSICFVTGEPGAGKSTLLEEFSRRASLEYPDLVFAAGDCNPQTGTVDPYLPFREIMSDLTGAEEPPNDKQGRSNGFFQAAARMLAEHGPDLIDIFVPGGAIVTRVGAQAANKIRSRKHVQLESQAGNLLKTDGDLEQTHLLEQYTNVILALAEEQALVLLIDDLHWADEASITLLFHLSRRLGSARVFIIGAYRAHEITLGRNGERHPLEPTLNELKRYHGDIWIDLGDIQADAKRQFVDQLLDAECNVNDEAFRTALFERTHGHALFTIEMVQYLKESNYLLVDDLGQWQVSPDLRWDGLPARVEGVISERIDRLDPEQQELLTSASIVGESFAAEIPASMLKLDLRAVVRSLSGALSKSHALVKAEGFDRTGGRRMSVYRFKHNLIHKYFYQSTDEIERGFLHEEAAIAMETSYGEESAVVAVQLARHYLKAEIAEKSIKYLLLAAHQARSAYAHKEALSHGRKALEILGNSSSGELSAQWVKDTNTEIYTLLGKVLERSGEFEAARKEFEKALDTTDESAYLPRVALKREIATTFERQHQHDMALETLNQAASLFSDNFNPDNDAEMAEWITVRNQQLWINYWQGNTGVMQDLISDIKEMVTTRGSGAQKRQFYRAIVGLGNRLNRFAPDSETIEVGNKSLAAIQDSDSLLEQADVTFATGFILLHAGDHERAAELIIQSLELARRCGDRTTQARCLAYLTIVKRKSGDPQSVEKYLLETEEICEALQMREYVAVVLANRSWLAWKTGDQKNAIKLSSDAMENWQKHSPGYPFKWLALLQVIDIALDNSGLGKATEYAKILLDQKNAKLIGGVEEAFDAAISDHANNTPDMTASKLADALELAKKTGYL
jgi:tetratricopeptide (TPR) repeat protein